MTGLIFSAAFTAVAGGATGFGVAVWRGLQRTGTLLCGVNPDMVGLREIKPVRAVVAGVFLGAAAGAGGYAAYEHRDAILDSLGTSALLTTCSHNMSMGGGARIVQDENGKWTCVLPPAPAQNGPK